MIHLGFDPVPKNTIPWTHLPKQYRDGKRKSSNVKLKNS